jgi:hypothetical protein
MEIVTQRFLLRDFIPADEPAFLGSAIPHD